jgi:hypothetical protein
MVLGGVALFLLVRRYGETLSAPAAAAVASGAPSATSAEPDTVLHLLLALAAVVVIGRLLGFALRSVGQPPVIGEVVAGILLGPSLLGRLAPELASYILPASVAPFLNVVAQLGVVAYIFLVGLELNVDVVRERAHATIATSHASIVLPFVLGSVARHDADDNAGAGADWPGIGRATGARANRCQGQVTATSIGYNLQPV